MMSKAITMMVAGALMLALTAAVAIAAIQLTLDRYSHWMPSMGKHSASAMDEALG
jgi:hypothetical protein